MRYTRRGVVCRTWNSGTRNTILSLRTLLANNSCLCTNSVCTISIAATDIRICINCWNTIRNHWLEVSDLSEGHCFTLHGDYNERIISFSTGTLMRKHKTSDGHCMWLDSMCNISYDIDYNNTLSPSLSMIPFINVIIR